MAKRGKPPRFVRDKDGKEIHGLSAQPAKNRKGEIIGYRFYATFADPRVWIGTYPTRDDPVGIMEFRRWEYQQTGEKIDIIITKPIRHDTFGDTGEDDWSSFVIDKDGIPRSEIGISADDFWNAVREAILHDPQMVAQRTGIPAIARLDRLPKPLPAQSLVTIGDLYFEAKFDDCNPEGMANTKKWWNEFVDIVGKLDRPVQTTEELNHDAFVAYAKRIRAAEKKISPKTKKPYSSSYRRSRFNTVCTILNYAYDCRRLSEDQIARLRADWKVPLKRPPARKGKKVIITPQEFAALLDKANDYEKAMLLMGVNCAFYPVDFNIQWEQVNLDEGTMVFRREKKDEAGIEGTTRVAVLWKKTVEALQVLYDRGTTSYVFATRSGLPPHRTEVLRRIKKLVKAAGIKRNIRAEDLRNTAATMASRSAPSNQYNVLMGHALPSEDAGYIEGNPFYVADACKAIGEYLGIE